MLALHEINYQEMIIGGHWVTGYDPGKPAVPDSFPSGGGFRFHYDGADGVALSDEPYVAARAVNLVGVSNGSPALTNRYRAAAPP